jgi:hypothetical protein
MDWWFWKAMPEQPDIKAGFVALCPMLPIKARCPADDHRDIAILAWHSIRLLGSGW